MKNLLLILVLFTAPAFAQEADTTTLRSLVSLYWEYQKECIEDTTVWVFTPSNVWMTLREFETHPEWKRYSVLTEKRTRPESLNGFITFINNRIKQPSPRSKEN